jgi:hypothetical protein
MLSSQNSDTIDPDQASSQFVPSEISRFIEKAFAIKSPERIETSPR